MSLLMTRAPYRPYVTKEWQAKMHKIESCINCRRCVAPHCPYSLDTPRLLRDQLHWYENFCQRPRVGDWGKALLQAIAATHPKASLCKG